MATIAAKKSVFEMSPGEIHDYLKPTAQALRETALDSGAWYSYTNELCIEPNMFIREFKDGKKQLIQLGDQTGEFKVLKVF